MRPISILSMKMSDLQVIFRFGKQENVKCFTGFLPSGKGSDEETYARL